MGNNNCRNCRRDKEILSSQARIYKFNTATNTIFIHNGNLISYCILDSFSNKCKKCSNFITDCVYTKDGKYYTLSKHSSVTAIDCAIKKPLLQMSMIIMGTEIGVFIMPMMGNLQKLLFVRGIKINYNPQGWVDTVYSHFSRVSKTSENTLMRVIFTGFADYVEKIVYLIDNKGNPLEYETLSFTGEEYTTPKMHNYYWSAVDDWKIYANDKMCIKTHGYYERAEILEDRAPVGRRTKPALRAFDYDG